MEMMTIATKHWFRVSETVWQLLVEVDRHVYHKTVVIYNTQDDYSSVLETNKKLKEFDLIEQVWKELGIKLKLI
jgi:hypothetical protein